MNSRQGWGVGMAALGAVGFSGKAIIVKLAYRHGVDAVTLLMWRMLLALPLFLALAWWAGRGRPALSARDWRDVGVLGFTGYYLASFLDFAGLQYISAGLERLFLYLNPTLVLLLGVLFLGQRVGRRQTVALALSYAGVLLVFAHEVRYDGVTTWIGSALV
ncbi:MAG: DMT family transporter, partial [Inhella sp.]